MIALVSTIEYKGTTMATCEVAWLERLLAYLGQSIHGAIVIYCDNISNIMLVIKLFYHARTEHIEEHYYLMREKVLVGEVDIVYVSMKEQVNNIFTKALDIEKLHRF